MKKVIYCLLIAIVTINSKSNAQTWTWVKDIESSTNSNLMNTKSATDANGNTYTAGNYGELMMGGNLYIDNTTLTSVGGIDHFVVKYNASGSVIWKKSFGSTDGEDTFSDIVCDANGNVYVAGVFSSNLNIDGTIITANQSDLFLLKFNSAGVLQWAQQSNLGLSQMGVVLGISIAIDANNNCFIVGNYINTCVFGSGSNTVTLSSIGQQDIFLCKYSTNGVLQWAKSMGSIENEHPFDLKVDASGNAVFAGMFGSSTNNTITINGNVFTSAGGSDIFIAKYNTNGNYVWATVAGGTANDLAKSLCIDLNSNIYVVGGFGGSTGVSASFGNITLNSAGRSDVFLAKYSSTGSVIWAKAGGGTTSDGVFEIALNSTSGILYLAVQGSATANYGGLSIGTGLKIIKYSKDGIALNFISTSNNNSNIAINTWNNNLICSGFYNDSLTFGVNTVNISPNHLPIALYTASYNEVPPPAPSITNFSPLEGVIGSSVIIKGENFTGVSSVSFNNINATTFKAINDSTIIAVVPENASTGKIKVIVSNNTLTSINDFTVRIINNNSYAWQWAMQSTTSSSADKTINDACVDLTGNIYSIGAFKNSFTIGTNTLSSLGLYDAFLLKNDVNGNVLWVKRIGGANGDDEAYGVSTDAFGNIYLTGYFTGSITIDNTSLTSFGNTDIFILKFSSDGNLLWARNAGGTDQDMAFDIKVDAFGNAYLTGNFYGNASFGGINLNTYSSYVKTFIAMYDVDGNSMWAKEVTGTANNYGNSVSYDANGNCYVMGYFSIGLNFEGTSITSGINNISYFLAKYNSTGTLIWAKRIDGDFIANVNQMAHIIADASGNIFIAGSEYISNTKVSMIAKYATDGTLIWKKTAGSLSQNYAYDIALANNGEITIVGQISSTTSFDNINLEIQNLFGNEMYVVRFDAQGNALSSYQPINTNVNTEKCFAVCIDNYNNIYTSGYFSGTPTFGPISLTSNTIDLFVAKITSNAVGIKNDESTNIKIYPNPVQDSYLIIENINNELYEIINIMGQVIQFGKIENNRIDVSNLTEGIYTLKTKTGTAKFVMKK